MKNEEDYVGQELQAYLKGEDDYERFLASHFGGGLPGRINLLDENIIGVTSNAPDFPDSPFYEPPYEYQRAYDDGWQATRDNV